jgi:hypothetical protein
LVAQGDQARKGDTGEHTRDAVTFAIKSATPGRRALDLSAWRLKDWGFCLRRGSLCRRPIIAVHHTPPGPELLALAATRCRALQAYRMAGTREEKTRRQRKEHRPMASWRTEGGCRRQRPWESAGASNPPDRMTRRDKGAGSVRLRPVCSHPGFARSPRLTYPAHPRGHRREVRRHSQITGGGPGRGRTARSVRELLTGVATAACNRTG